MIECGWMDAVDKVGPTTVAALAAIAATVSALWTIRYVIKEYERSRKWKQNDLAAVWLDKLNTDPSLALACQALDWGVGPLTIPEQYRALFPASGSAPLQATMEHDPLIMWTALAPELQTQTLRDRRGLVYRLCFDKFFSYLDQVYRLLKDEQLRREDLTILHFWLIRLQDYPYTDSKHPPADFFVPAIEDWGYSNVRELWGELGARPPERNPMRGAPKGETNDRDDPAE